MNTFLKLNFFLLFLLGMSCQSHQVQPPPVKPQPTQPKEEPTKQSMIQEQPVPDHLFRVCDNGMCYFIDSTGKTIIPPYYYSQYTSEFSEGLCPVSLIDISTCTQCIGFIDSKSQMVIPPQFSYARNFTEGLAVVGTEDGFGLINHSGKFVIPPIYKTCPEDAKEGYVLVSPADKGQQYLDLQGNLKIQGKADWRYLPFSDGVAIVNPPLHSTLSSEVIDPSGKVLFQLESHLEFKYGFSEGLAPVFDTLTNKYGSVDKTGKVVIPCLSPLTVAEFSMDFGNYRAFHEGLAVTTRDGKKMGFIDKTNKFVIKPQFDHASSFSEGVAFVRKGKKSYFIDKKGNPAVIPETYCLSDHKFSNFKNGLACDNTGFIDKTGKYIWK